MAVVHLARDGELDRRVAVKLLDSRLADDPAFRQRFEREAALAARLAHTNVVRVFDAGEDAGRPFIVMEYVEGETLGEVLRRRRRLPPEEVARLGRQICAGLHHAHAAGLVHRDVKPGNLLVARDGTVKIADFGVARALEATQLTAAGTILGTAAYLSPEQAAGEPVTHKADLYALGVVLYELLAGVPPYPAETIADLGAARRRPVPPLDTTAPATPPWLEQIVLRCLDPDPERRPESAAAVAEELARGADAPTEPLAARRVSTMVLPPPPPPRRRPLVAVVATAVAAVAAVAVAVALTREGDGGREPPAVQPSPRGSSPGQQARNLASWLRENAG